MLKDAFDQLTQRIAAAAQKIYGDRLVSVVLYGSVARGTMRHDSDIDLLIVARDLPAGRLNRVREFEAVEEAVEEHVKRAAGARVLYDRQGFFAQRLARLRDRLSELGAKRVWKGNAWYWDLKPDYRQGEVFEL